MSKRHESHPNLRSHRPRVLVAGWFSFPFHHATAGDLIACDVVCDWLVEAGIRFDIARAAPFVGGVNWGSVRPEDYTHLVYVCGPVGPSRKSVVELLDRFAQTTRVAVNVTMQEPLEAWNPFDVLIERDSSAISRPDVTFAAPRRSVPVVGLVLVEPSPPEEYLGRDMQRRARDAISRLLHAQEVAVVSIDTRLDVNAGGLRTPAEIESLIAHMDVVVTTRLHGMVLALRNGIPALAVDSIAAGAKIRLQAERIGWPAVLTADSLSDEDLRDAFFFCLSDEGRTRAAECAAQARADIGETRSAFLAAVAPPSGAPRSAPTDGPVLQVTARGEEVVNATVVVIAESGSERLLEECMESLSECMPRAAEILVVETQGSRLGGVDQVGGQKVQALPGPHASRGAALNTALRRAQNDVVLIILDDCLASAGWVGAGWKRVASDPAALFTGQVLPLQDSRRVPTNMHAPRPQLLPPMTNWGETHGWVMACDRRHVLSAGGFEEATPMAEDLDLRYRLTRSGSKVEYVPDLIVWRQNWRTPQQLRQFARASAIQRGAFYGKHLRKGDRAVARLAGLELRAGLRSLGATLRRRRRSWADPRRGILTGLPIGLARGWRARGFRD